MDTSWVDYNRRLHIRLNYNHGMRQELLWKISACLFSTLSCILLVWGYYPSTYVTNTLTFSPEEIRDLVVADKQNDIGGLWADFNDSYYLSLIVPKTIRMNDQAQVQVLFETRSHEVENKQNQSKNNNGMYVNALLELTGMNVEPSAVISQPILPDKALAYQWQAAAESPGVYSGTMWLSLRLVSSEGGEPITRSLSAQRVEISIISLWGMDGRTARWVGLGGLLLVVVFFVKLLVRKRVNQQQNEDKVHG